MIVGGVLLALWSAARNAPVEFWALGAINNNPGRMIRANEIVPRLVRWLGLLHNVIGLTPLLVLALWTGTLEAKDKEAKLEAKAKISKEAAAKIALEKVPKGKVKEAELEKEKGKLIWSFALATPGTTDTFKTATYREFESTGQGASIATREPGSKRLTKAEAAAWSRKKFLAGADGWRP